MASRSNSEPQSPKPPPKSPPQASVPTPHADPEPSTSSPTSRFLVPPAVPSTTSQPPTTIPFTTLLDHPIEPPRPSSRAGIETQAASSSMIAPSSSSAANERAQIVLQPPSEPPARPAVNLMTLAPEVHRRILLNFEWHDLWRLTAANHYFSSLLSTGDRAWMREQHQQDHIANMSRVRAQALEEQTSLEIAPSLFCWKCVQHRSDFYFEDYDKFEEKRVCIPCKLRGNPEQRQVVVIIPEESLRQHRDIGHRCTWTLCPSCRGENCAVEEFRPSISGSIMSRETFLPLPGESFAHCRPFCERKLAREVQWEAFWEEKNRWRQERVERDEQRAREREEREARMADTRWRIQQLLDELSRDRRRAGKKKAP